MPRYDKCTAIILLFRYENDNFLYQLLSKHTSKCITCCTFSKNFREAYYPISNVQVKSLFFLSQNGNFGEYLKTKSDQNILNKTEILQITEIALFSTFSRTIIASAQL